MRTGAFSLLVLIVAIAATVQFVGCAKEPPEIPVFEIEGVSFDQIDPRDAGWLHNEVLKELDLYHDLGDTSSTRERVHPQFVIDYGVRPVLERNDLDVPYDSLVSWVKKTWAWVNEFKDSLGVALWEYGAMGQAETREAVFEYIQTHYNSTQFDMRQFADARGHGCDSLLAAAAEDQDPLIQLIATIGQHSAALWGEQIEGLQSGSCDGVTSNASAHAYLTDIAGAACFGWFTGGAWLPVVIGTAFWSYVIDMCEPDDAWGGSGGGGGGGGAG